MIKVYINMESITHKVLHQIYSFFIFFDHEFYVKLSFNLFVNSLL